MSANSIPEHKKFRHEAMAAPFEILIAHVEEAYAGQAARAAFSEIDKIEQVLSRFIDSSDISQINHAAVGHPVKIGIYTHECLTAAQRAWKETGGAFDVTIGPLMSVWRNPDKTQREPSAEELARAREKVGMGLLEINDEDRTVTVKRAGVQVDLGGIGKGYAVERAAEVLTEWDVESALINGGTSTVYAMAAPPGAEGWPVGVGGVGDEPEPRRMIQLQRKALSGSGLFVKGKHILDPRTGRPAEGKLAAWSLCPSATMADALSTAFFVMDISEVDKYCQEHPDTSAMIIQEAKKEKDVLTFGAW